VSCRSICPLYDAEQDRCELAAVRQDATQCIPEHFLIECCYCSCMTISQCDVCLLAEAMSASRASSIREMWGTGSSLRITLDIALPRRRP
jgi:hypothetical protein